VHGENKKGNSKMRYNNNTWVLIRQQTPPIVFKTAYQLLSKEKVASPSDSDIKELAMNDASRDCTYNEDYMFPS
jgi:hypothetical protein